MAKTIPWKIVRENLEFLLALYDSIFNYSCAGKTHRNPDPGKWKSVIFSD